MRPQLADWGGQIIGRVSTETKLTKQCPFFLSGMAGTIYFLADLLHPMSARFPAFEV